MDIGKIGTGFGTGFGTKKAEPSVKQAQDQNFETVLRRAVEEKDEKGLKEACQQFESIFIQMMYSQMKSSVMKTELMPQDPGRETFEGLMDEELSKKASNRGIGIADMLYKQLSKQLPE